MKRNPCISREQWQRVGPIVIGAIEMADQEVTPYVYRMTGGDRDLRHVVEKVLRACREAKVSLPFLDSSVGDFAAPLFDPALSGPPDVTEITSGDTIGQYVIERRLGSGGMGVVYLARDPVLGRHVAVKVLPPWLASAVSARERFVAEAKAASALEHPNIGVVYEFGVTSDGRSFMAMAYHEGETLRDRIERGELNTRTCIEVAAQMASALAAAHARGIVHRDIKPGNVIVTPSGQIRVVDFGAAKLAGHRLTVTGGRLGTLAYMSPEQTRGDEVDSRTDVWSLGVVLYEMLTGTRPFRGESDRTLIHSIRHDDPPPREIHPEIPTPLGRVVARCLAKDPASRYRDAGALHRDLIALREGAPTRPGLRRFAPSRVAVAAAAIAVIVAIIALLDPRSEAGESVLSADVMQSAGSPPMMGETTAPGIAILPFEVGGEGLGVWREGMVDLLSIGLEGVEGLRVIDSRTVLARWRERAPEVGALDLETSLAVARRTGARYAVSGSVVSSGFRLRLGAHVHAVEDGRRLASLQVEGSPDSLFALVDRLSIDVLAAIWQGKERPRHDVDLTRITTTSLPALKAFLEGESLLRREKFDDAIAAYERAIAADSTFAYALYHLGLAYKWTRPRTGDDSRFATESFQRARRHAGRLPEREALLLRAGLAYNIPDQSGKAIELLREATRKYPDDADAWFLLGEILFHGGEQALAAQGESDEALRKAVELDPGFALSYGHLVNNAFIYRPDSARAARLIAAYHRVAPNDLGDHWNRIGFGLAFGDSTRRREALAALDTLPLGNLRALAWVYLDHPRFWSIREAVLQSRPHPATVEGWIMSFQLFETALSQGELEAALTHLEDPRFSRGLRAAGHYRIHSAGQPISAVVLGRALAGLPTGELPADIGSFAAAFYAGAYAADQGRWDDHAAVVTQLRGYADRQLAAGDSARSRFARGAALALEGQGLWRRGNVRRAASLLVEGQRHATWLGSANREAMNQTIRWWIGQLLLEQGKPREAALYFESFWHDPLAAWQLGPIYEQIGDPVRARQAYALVASAWKDADPALQPRARESRAAVQRLTR